MEGEQIEPLAFFSQKLNDAQRKYSTYDRELLAMYESVKYFRHMLEGRSFIIYTDHKPLIFAFKQKESKASPRQAMQLDFIGQFTTDIRHITGTENIAADAQDREKQSKAKTHASGTQHERSVKLILNLRPTKSKCVLVN